MAFAWFALSNAKKVTVLVLYCFVSSFVAFFVMSEPPEVIYKVLVVGPPAVGKTCLIRRYVHGVFTSATPTTVMVDFSMKVVPQPSRTVNLRLWDIQGQEQPGYLGRTYYGGAVGAVVVCDASKADTLKEAVSWKKDIETKVFLPGTSDEPVPCFLCCNKCDLTTPPKEDMDRFCDANGFVGWLPTSGMKDINVCAAFNSLISAIDRSMPVQERKEEESPAPFPRRPKKDSRCKC